MTFATYDVQIVVIETTVNDFKFFLLRVVKTLIQKHSKPSSKSTIISTLCWLQFSKKKKTKKLKKKIDASFFFPDAIYECIIYALHYYAITCTIQEINEGNDITNNEKWNPVTWMLRNNKMSRECEKYGIDWYTVLYVCIVSVNDYFEYF